MPLLAKKQGGASIGEYVWEHDNESVDVDQGLFDALLKIQGGDFYAPEPAPQSGDDADVPEHAAEAHEVGAEAEPQAPAPAPVATPVALVGDPAAAIPVAGAPA